MGCETLSEFLYLCFGLDPVPQMFKKVPLAVLRRLNMLIRIYIDIIIGWTRKEVESTKNTLIYLLQPFKVLSEFEAICASTMSGNRISELYSKFCESDSLTALTQGVEGPGGVDKDVQ